MNFKLSMLTLLCLTLSRNDLLLIKVMLLLVLRNLGVLGERCVTNIIVVNQAFIEGTQYGF
jgi:hypothetical protein